MDIDNKGSGQSPLGQLFATVIARDEADRAIEFAALQARLSSNHRRRLRDEAMAHALSCIEACDAQGIEYDEETLSHNVEGNFPDLDIDECDEVAIAAIAKTPGSAA